MKSHSELTNTTWSNVIDRSFSPRHICFTGPTSQTHPGAVSSKYFCLFASQSRFQLLNLMIENNPHQSWLSESQQWGPSDYMISSSLLFSPQPPSAAATCSFKATTPPCTVCSLKQQDGGGEGVRGWGLVTQRWWSESRSKFMWWKAFINVTWGSGCIDCPGGRFNCKR